MNVDWRVPREVRLAAEPWVTEWAPLAPRWVATLVIETADPDGDTILDSLGKPEYRQAKIRIYPRFLTRSNELRRVDMLHEFMHLPYEPVRDVFHALLKAAIEPDSDLAIWAEEAHRLAMEGCVTDLELGIGRLLQSEPHRDGHE